MILLVNDKGPPDAQHKKKDFFQPVQKTTCLHLMEEINVVKKLLIVRESLSMSPLIAVSIKGLSHAPMKAVPQVSAHS